MQEKHAKLMMEMIAFDKGDASRIQHFVKVHNFATTIAMMEGVDERTLDIIETATILHDIGIHPAEQKYGSDAGPYQEELGPAEADVLLRKVGGFDEEEIERVKFLIAHHHTYANIDKIDYQILVEADFLVNLFEHGNDYESADRVKAKIFKTSAGMKILDDMFLEESWKF